MNLLESVVELENLSDKTRKVLTEALAVQSRRGNMEKGVQMMADLALLIQETVGQNIDDTPDRIKKDIVKRFTKNRPELAGANFKGEFKRFHDRVINRGHSGVVYYGQIIRTVELTQQRECLKLAIKLVPFTLQVLRELIALDQCTSHEYIVKYLGYYYVTSPDRPPGREVQYVGLVFEQCAYTLSGTVAEPASAGDCTREVAALVNPFKVILELCVALAYMHLYDLVHRDIRPSNVLIKEGLGLDRTLYNSTIKITDMGLARFLTAQPIYTMYPQDEDGYRAPEQNTGNSGWYNDIYSVGKVMIFLTCHPVFEKAHEVYQDWMKLADAMTVNEFNDRTKLATVAKQMKFFSERVTREGTSDYRWRREWFEPIRKRAPDADERKAVKEEEEEVEEEKETEEDDEEEEEEGGEGVGEGEGESFIRVVEGFADGEEDVGVKTIEFGVQPPVWLVGSARYLDYPGKRNKKYHSRADCGHAVRSGNA